VGIITTAQKKKWVKEEHLVVATDSMLALNVLGTTLGNLPYVNAMTDVTGFGLLGHLCEVCEGSGLSAQVDFTQIPKFPFLDDYIGKDCIPGGTIRNWDSYGKKINRVSDYQRAILADPQTSGGLLVCVDESSAGSFEKLSNNLGYKLKPFGKLVPKENTVITVL
jgi:selenide,water dikinase